MRASAALRASVAPGGVLAGPWVRNELWRRARMMPSLDLPFADYKSLTDLVSGRGLITFTRAYSGTFVGSDRLIQSAGVDVPRFTHDPVTGESLGLLSEEQRVNLLLRSEEFDQSPWSLASGTITANTQTAPDGNTTADVVTATATTPVVFQSISKAASAVTYTASLWLRSSQVSDFSITIDDGTPLNRGRARFNPVAGTIGTITSEGEFTNTTATILPFPNSWYRCTITTTTNAQATARVRLFFSGINNTVDLWGAQLEEGSSATSYIKTEASTVTRSADVIDLISAAIANNIRTLYLEFRSPAVGTRGVASLNDNTANERTSVITSGTDPRLVVVDGGVEQANINDGTVVANARTRVAVRIDTNSFAISINGGPVVTDTSGTLPTVDRLMIGRTQAGEYLNGPIARLTGWEQPLPDSALRALAC
jgi:hypothetical protein